MVRAEPVSAPVALAQTRMPPPSRPGDGIGASGPLHGRRAILAAAVPPAACLASTRSSTCAMASQNSVSPTRPETMKIMLSGR